MTPKLLPKVSTKEEFGIFKQDLSNSPEPIVFIRENWAFHEQIHFDPIILQLSFW